MTLQDEWRQAYSTDSELARAQCYSNQVITEIRRSAAVDAILLTRAWADAIQAAAKEYQ